MKVIKCDLPEELTHIELHIFADEHIGDEHCDMQRLKDRIKYVAEKPDAYCILNGDILDNASKTSIGDTYTQTHNVMEQIEEAVELFSPIRHKTLAVLRGNHEGRAYKEGVDLSSIMAARLGLLDKYSPTAALLFVRFGKQSSGKKETNGSGKVRKMCYTIYALHGSGGGRKASTKVGRLEEMAGIIDSDCYIHSHTHLPITMKQGFHRIDTRNSTVAIVDKLFINTAANLNYGGYGEAQEYKPSSKQNPVIHLNGQRKDMYATL